MKLASVFQNHGKIPAKYTCTGEGISPPLTISDVPINTKSLVLIMDDPDIPDFVKESRGIEVFDHWVVFNISPETRSVEEATEPKGILGKHSAGKLGYTGPCPPDGEHRYFFKLYALDKMLDLNEGSTKAEVEKTMKDHIIEQAELMGLFSK